MAKKGKAKFSLGELKLPSDFVPLELEEFDSYQTVMKNGPKLLLGFVCWIKLKQYNEQLQKLEQQIIELEEQRETLSVEMAELINTDLPENDDEIMSFLKTWGYVNT